MAKTATPASKRRPTVDTRKQDLKRMKKKQAPRQAKLQKQKILGKVNGFTVTRLEPEKLKLTRIFPEHSQSPATEGKRVTFAWAEVAEQKDDSRSHRAKTRRTHSARDSSEDSLNDFDASREPKRRRTIESDIVEDAEMRKATSSMRHCKASLQHSTPAEMLDIPCSSSKRVFPRTPKPTDKKSASPNDTFGESTYGEEEGEGYSEPKVSLASLFDEETHEGGAQRGLLEGASAPVTAGSSLAGGAERASLNSDDTTLDLEAAPSGQVGNSRLSESKSLNESSDVTPVRVHSTKLRDVSKEVVAQEEPKKKSKKLPEMTSEDSELFLNLSEGTGPADEVGVDSPCEDPQRKTKSVSPPKDDSFSSLDERSVSRLSRRNSGGSCEPTEAGDVFKQRRSQLTLDEEEPMEISGIQNASRLSNAQTPKPIGNDGNESHEVTSSSAVQRVGSVAVPGLEEASDNPEAVVLRPEQEVINDLVVATEAVMAIPNQDDSPVRVSVPDPANSDQEKTAHPKQSLSTSFDEDDDAELQRLSLRIKKLSERDETMESPRSKAIPENSMLSAEVLSAPDQTTLPVELTEENSSKVEGVSQVESSSALEAKSTLEAPPVPMPASSAVSMAASVPAQDVTQTPSETDAVAPSEAPPISEVIPCEDAPPVSDTAASKDAPPMSEMVAPASDEVPSDDVPPISKAGSPGEATPAPERMESDAGAPTEDSSPSDAPGDVSDVSNAVEEAAKVTSNSNSVPLNENNGNVSDAIVKTSHDPSEPESGGAVEKTVDSTEPSGVSVSPVSEGVETLHETEHASGHSRPGDELVDAGNEVRDEKDQTPSEKSGADEVQAEHEKPSEIGEPVAENPADHDPSQWPPEEAPMEETALHEESVEPSATSGDAAEVGREDSETETASTTSEQRIDPIQNLEGRQKRVRRNTKIFSPPPSNVKTTPAPSATKKKAARTKATTAETPMAVPATPRSSKRVAAKAPPKAAAELDAEEIPDVEDDTTPPAKKGRTPSAKSVKTPAPKAEKTPAKAKTARTPSAKAAAAKAETESSEASGESSEETLVPKTPGRATGAKKAASAKAPKTPTATSKASAATPSAKAAKTKAESSAAVKATSPPKGTKSSAKPSKTTTAASSRRKTAK